MSARKLARVQPAALGPPVPDDGHIVPLRPYGLGELFTGAGRVLTRAPRPVLASGLIASAILIGVELAAGPILTTHRGTDGAEDVHVHALGLIAWLARLLTIAIVQAVMFQVTLSLAAGTLPNSKRIYARALRLLPLLIGVQFVRVTSLLILGLFVVGVFLFVQWAFAGCVLTAEDTRFVDAFRRSADLVRGSWWRVTGLLILASLVTSTPQSVVQSAFNVGHRYPFSAHLGWPAILAGGLAMIPLNAFGTAFVCLLYVDLRCRQEGLAWKLDAARRGPEREPFGPIGVYAALPWRSRR